MWPTNRRAERPYRRGTICACIRSTAFVAAVVDAIAPPLLRRGRPAEAENATLNQGDDDDQPGEDEGARRGETVSLLAEPDLEEIDERWSRQREIPGRGSGTA